MLNNFIEASPVNRSSTDLDYYSNVSNQNMKIESLVERSLGSLTIGRCRLIFVDDVEEFVRKQVKDQASRPFAGEAQ
jgi:hypothetical protein